MGDFMDALLWSKEIVEFRKTVVPKVQSMEKERMDLKFKRLMEWGDQLVGSGQSKEEAPEKKPTQLPEITPWHPPSDVHQLCSEISEMNRISAKYQSCKLFQLST